MSKLQYQPVLCFGSLSVISQRVEGWYKEKDDFYSDDDDDDDLAYLDGHGASLHAMKELFGRAWGQSCLNNADILEP